MRTLQTLRESEEARWEAERKANAESVRSAELESRLRQLGEESAEREAAGEKRAAQHALESADLSEKYVDAERLKVGLASRGARATPGGRGGWKGGAAVMWPLCNRPLTGM